MTVYQEIFEVLKLRKKAFDEGNAPEKSYTCYLYEKALTRSARRLAKRLPRLSLPQRTATMRSLKTR